MKKLSLALLMLTFAIVGSNAQEIKIKDVFVGYKFIQNGRTLNIKQLPRAVKSNSEAYQLVKSAKSMDFFAQALVAVAGGMMVYPITLSGGEPNWTIVGIGIGLAVVYIPVNMNINSKLKKGVELYNKGIKSAYNYDTPQINFVINNKGIGFSINF